MKAKWYHREIEKTLVSVISKDMAEIEQKNIPAKRRGRLIRQLYCTWKGNDSSNLFQVIFCIKAQLNSHESSPVNVFPLALVLLQSQRSKLPHIVEFISVIYARTLKSTY